MGTDDNYIWKFIRETLEKEGRMRGTALHREVFSNGRGYKNTKFGEQAVWNVMTSRVEQGALIKESEGKQAVFYSLTDITNNISKILDGLFKDFEVILERLEIFHEHYAKPKSQTESNYLIRLMELTKISRELMKKQSYLSLVIGFKNFSQHKSWKRLNKTVDELWTSIRWNAVHQLGNNDKFLQELIWSLQGYARDEHSKKLYSGFM